MASSRHQFILGLVVKRMRQDGAKIYGVDGNYPGLLGEKISMPPQIMRHRPDAIGVKPDGQISIGEAKTETDLSSSRTYEQIQDFSTMEMNGKLCEVYIGIPQAGEELFRKCIDRLGLKDCDNIHILTVPDMIIND